MYGKITFFLALCWLSLLSAQAQVVSSESNSTNAVSTTEAWWKHVESLKQKGVTGTSGKILRYDEPEGQKILKDTPFAGKKDGDDVTIDGGTFYDIDFKNLRITITGGAQVSFYNCRFGQDADVRFKGKNGSQGKDCVLCPEGKDTKVTLRFCDFEGPGNGAGLNAMLLANISPYSGQAATVDAEYCRTWGQSGDSWKVARSTSRFSYFDPAVCTEKKPILWKPGKYQEGDYVTEEDIYSAHIWRAKQDTKQKPRFDLKGKKGREHNQTKGNEWQYINPHADIFHIYGGAFETLAEGHYINQDTDNLAEKVDGVALVGLNNTIRRADPPQNWSGIHGSDTVRGCYIPRRKNENSFSIHNTLGASQDSEWLRLEHLRLGGPLNKVIYPPKENQKPTRVALDGLQDLNGNPLRIQEVDQRTYDASEMYFDRGNPHSEAPTLRVASKWRIRFNKDGFAPARRGDGSPMEAVIFVVNGQRALIFKKGDTGPQVAKDSEGLFSLRSVGDNTYELSSTDGIPFYPVRWRGEAKLLDGGDPVTENTTGEGNSIRLTEFSRDKAPFDSGAGRKKNSARIPFKATVRNAQNQPVSGAVVEGRIVTATGQPVAPWKVIGTTNSKGEAQGNLYTPRHPEYLQREVRIQGNNQVTDQSENSFGVGHTLIVFAQSNVDQGFKNAHGKIPKPQALSADMVQHYYHERFDQAKKGVDLKNKEKVGKKYLRHWSTGVNDDQDVTGWPTAFANVLTESRPGEKFFVVWHVHQGTDYEDMVSSGGDRLPEIEKFLADTVYADGQDRGGIAGGAWTHSPRRFGEFFDESHFPIFFKRTADGNPIDIPNEILWGHPSKNKENKNNEENKLTIDHWIGEWYDLNHLTYSFQDPHQFADAQDPSKSAYENTNKIRQAIRDLVKNPHAVDFNGNSAILPIYMGALNYAIGERKGAIFDDLNHPADNTPDGGMLFNALIAHGFLRAAGLTDWPEPVFNRHYRDPKGQWWEWWSTAGPVTTTRLYRSEPRPNKPAGIPTDHWTPVVGFRIDGQPATKVELTENGRVRIYAPTGDPFANTPEGLARISHGDGGASGHLNNAEDRIAELWKDIAIIHFKGLPGFQKGEVPTKSKPMDGIALRAQLPPRFGEDAGDSVANEYEEYEFNQGEDSTTAANDTTAPSVDTVWATPTEITVVYSERIRPRGFGRVFINTVPANQRAVDIKVTQEGTTPGTIEYDGTKVIVRPALPLPAGKYAWRPQHTIFEDLAGNLAEDVVNNYYHPFTIGASARTATDRDKMTLDGEALGSSLYPNPSHGLFTVHLPEAEGHPTTISILSLSGQVLSEVQTQGERRMLMQTSLSPGTYLVRVVSPEASYVERLIVE